MSDKCSKCGAKTELHENGIPICVKCAEAIESARKRTATEATAQHREAPPEAVSIGSGRLARSKGRG
jgi:hypothetical protein